LEVLYTGIGLDNFVGVKVVSFHKTSVDKDPSGSRVDQSLYKERLKSVSNLKSNKKMEKSFIDIKSTNSKV